MTANEFVAVRRAIWAPWYWLNLINHYMVRHMLLIGIGACICVTLYTGMLRPMGPVLAVLLGLAILGGAYLWIMSSQKPSQSQLATMNADLPKSIEILPSGITTTNPDGVMVQIPWRILITWKAGDGVYVLETMRNDMVILPFGRLLQTEAEDIHAMLLTHIGKATLPPRRSFLREQT